MVDGAGYHSCGEMKALDGVPCKSRR